MELFCLFSFVIRLIVGSVLREDRILKMFQIGLMVLTAIAAELFPGKFSTRLMK